MGYFIWFGFVVVAISDAREHRIPNFYLLIILLFCFVDKVLAADPINALAWSSLAGLCFFAAALALHLIRVMAPGDVKLLGVVGFWLGWGELLDATVWIAVASVVIGLLYAIVNRAENGISIKQLVTKYTMLAAYGTKSQAIVSESENVERKLRMPFAPVVVMGLAMHHYF